MKFFLCLVIVAVVSSKTEALKCYVCNHVDVDGTTAGDSSCADGKTPDDSLLTECTAIDKLQPVCMKVTTDGTIEKKKYTSTVRSCIKVEKVPSKCATEDATAPVVGKTTICYCNADKCDPKDDTNGSVTLLLSLPITVMLTLFAYLCPQIVVV